jgi:hypothetical protein
VLVRGALVGRGGLVADERRAGIEGERIEAGVDDRTVRGWADRRRRPDEEARLEGPGRAPSRSRLRPYSASIKM